MTTTFENIPAGEVSQRLASKGMDPDKPVTVLVDESMEDVIRRIRKEAKARGMTEEKYREIMKSLS